MPRTRDEDRGYWERHARKYDLSLRPLGRPLPPMLDLVTGYRRFTVRSLQQSLVATGLRLGRVETLPGLIPIGYVEGTFG